MVPLVPGQGAGLAREAQRNTTLLGLAAAMFALLQALVAASAALAAQPAVLTVQQALVTDAAGGGVTFDLLAAPLVRMYAVTYLGAALSFGITLFFCWQAGRLSAALTGRPETGAQAGLRIVTISTAVWLAGTLVVALFLHADGTIAWLIATLLPLAGASASSGVPGGLSVTHPSAAFVVIQLVALLVQALIGYLLALGLGALAGRLGAGS
ncbi:MAG TPA: hypothetical protein VFU88_04710 [Ktedonobacterales bacterium]|nr:hypothetical protein [Ktedonobacterales bacterium]